jgi:hypothetical protein
MNIKYYDRILLAIRLLMGVFAANLLLVNTSMAAPGNGAYVFKDSYCFDYEGSTVCYANMAVIQETITPSGNTIFMGNGSNSYIQTDPSGAVYQDTLKYHTQGVTMDSVLKEYGQFFTSTLTVGGAKCTTRYAFHFVNGEIQFERSTTCT